MCPFEGRRRFKGVTTVVNVCARDARMPDGRIIIAQVCYELAQFADLNDPTATVMVSTHTPIAPWFEVNERYVVEIGCPPPGITPYAALARRPLGPDEEAADATAPDR